MQKNVIAALFVVIGIGVGCGPIAPVVVPTVPASPSKPVHIVVKGADGQPAEKISGRLVRFDQGDVKCKPISEVMLECFLPDDLDYGALFTGRFTGLGYGELVEVVTAAPDVAIAGLPLLRIEPAIPPRDVILSTFQANFGGIKLPGCGLHRDNLFDPYSLERWLNDRPCFERMMDAHAVRGDNTIVIDPSAGYHGNHEADLWHNPILFDAFIQDIRRHINSRGEHFRVLVFLGADGHHSDMLAPGAFAHWQADVHALANVIRGHVEIESPCWECRHGLPGGLGMGNVSALMFMDMARFAHAEFPFSVPAVHLKNDSSSPSSWPCVNCPAPGDEGDPGRGNEIEAWHIGIREGWAGMFLFQASGEDDFINGDSYPADPSAGGQRGWLQRAWEILVRLGDDPWSLAASGGDRRTWPQVPVYCFECGVYPFYWDIGGLDESDLRLRCQQFLAIGGRGCGSASYRRP